MLGVAIVGADSVSNLHDSPIEETAGLQPIVFFKIEGATTRKRSVIPSSRRRTHQSRMDTGSMSLSQINHSWQGEYS